MQKKGETGAEKRDKVKRRERREEKKRKRKDIVKKNHYLHELKMIIHWNNAGIPILPI